MEMILVNAKTTDWMKSLSEIELPKPTHRRVFQWMENEIIPTWMFLEIGDRVLTIEDDEYFDEYNTEHHVPVQGATELRRPRRPGSSKPWFQSENSSRL